MLDSEVGDEEDSTAEDRELLQRCALPAPTVGESAGGARATVKTRIPTMTVSGEARLLRALLRRTSPSIWKRCS